MSISNEDLATALEADCCDEPRDGCCQAKCKERQLAAERLRNFVTVARDLEALFNQKVIKCGRCNDTGIISGCFSSGPCPFCDAYMRKTR